MNPTHALFDSRNNKKAINVDFWDDFQSHDRILRTVSTLSLRKQADKLSTTTQNLQSSVTQSNQSNPTILVSPNGQQRLQSSATQKNMTISVSPNGQKWLRNTGLL